MKISPRFRLIDSENGTKIVYAHSKENDYFIGERNVDQKTNQIELKDICASNDYISLTETFSNIKHKESDTLYSLFDKDTILSIKKIETDEGTPFSQITVFRQEDKTFFEIGNKIYKGVIYNLTLSNPKVGFLYYTTNNNEILYSIKIFKTIDDLLSGKVFKDIKSPHLGKICDISFTSDCNYMYSCGYDGWIKRWDLQAPNTAVQSIYLTNSPINTVRPNPFFDTLFVASCTNGNLIIGSFGKNQNKRRTIHISNDEQSNTLEPKSEYHGPAIWAEFSPVDPFLVVASGVSEIKTYYISDLFEL